MCTKLLRRCSFFLVRSVAQACTARVHNQVFRDTRELFENIVQISSKARNSDCGKQLGMVSIHVQFCGSPMTSLSNHSNQYDLFVNQMLTFEAPEGSCMSHEEDTWGLNCFKTTTNNSALGIMHWIKLPSHLQVCFSLLKCKVQTHRNDKRWLPQKKAKGKKRIWSIICCSWEETVLQHDGTILLTPRWKTDLRLATDSGSCCTSVGTSTQVSSIVPSASFWRRSRRGIHHRCTIHKHTHHKNLLLRQRKCDLFAFLCARGQTTTNTR